MGKVFINPNFHVLLIHYPLGIFFMGLLIEVFSFLYRASTLRSAGRWMILIGALATIPTAYSGIYALNDIAYRSQADGKFPVGQSWVQVRAGARLGGGSSTALAGARSDGNPRAVQWTGTDVSHESSNWAMLSRHVWVQGAASILVALTAVMQLGSSDRMRRRLYPLFMALFLIGAGLMSWGAWCGGEAVYRFGAATGLTKPLKAGADVAAAEPSAPQVREDPRLGLLILPVDLQPAIVLTPTSEPTTGTSPETLPAAATQPGGTTEPATLPTSPATEPATTRATTAPAPATEPVTLPTTLPATLPASMPIEVIPTTTPTTIPALISPLPPLIPPSIVRPIMPAAPTTLPVTQPTSTPTVPPIVSTITGEVAREIRAGKDKLMDGDDTAKLDKAAFYVGPPLQIHVLLAGLVTAISLAALGLSMRRLATFQYPVVLSPEAEAALADAEAEILANTQEPGYRPVSTGDLALVRTINPDVSITPSVEERLPVSRLWLLAFVAALLTAFVGVYFLAAPERLGGERIGWVARDIWSAIIARDQNKDGFLTRRLAHGIVGTCLILLPLIMAMLARWSRSRLVLSLLSLLLAACVAAQIWLGVLLLYDTNVGKINHWRTASDVPAVATNLPG